jgi:hypothetical protein
LVWESDDERKDSISEIKAFFIHLGSELRILTRIAERHVSFCHEALRSLASILDAVRVAAPTGHHANFGKRTTREFRKGRAAELHAGRTLAKIRQSSKKRSLQDRQLDEKVEMMWLLAE